MAYGIEGVNVNCMRFHFLPYVAENATKCVSEAKLIKKACRVPMLFL